MKKIFLIIISVTLLVYVNTAFAISSEFVRITPATEKEHNMHIQVRPVPNQENKYQIIIPMISEHKHAWLIICKKSIPPEKQNFRNYILGLNDDGRNIIVSAFLQASKSITTLIFSDSKTPKHFEINLDKEMINRAYVQIDYPTITLDGGFYYCIDLSLI